MARFASAFAEAAQQGLHLTQLFEGLSILGLSREEAKKVIETNDDKFFYRHTGQCREDALLLVITGICMRMLGDESHMHGWANRPQPDLGETARGHLTPKQMLASCSSERLLELYTYFAEEFV